MFDGTKKDQNEADTLNIKVLDRKNSDLNKKSFNLDTSLKYNKEEKTPIKLVSEKKNVSFTNLENKRSSTSKARIHSGILVKF